MIKNRNFHQTQFPGYAFSSVLPLHTDSPVWRTHGWSRTSLAEHRSFMLATATHLHPRFYMAFPQGSVLGPVLYVLYTSDVARLVEALGLGAHLYADDTQLHGHCPPANSFELASRFLRAIYSIHEWMSSNRLSLSLSQHRQDTIHLAWHKAQSCQERYRSALQSSSVPDWTYLREEPPLNYRSGVKHEGPYHQTLPNTHGSTLTYIICHPNFGSCLHLHASRFLQQPPLWDECLPPWPSPIGSKFCGTLDPQNWQIRSDLGCNSAWPSLASGYVSYSIQVQLHHENCLAGRAPEYRIELCHSVNDIPARRNLRSSSQVQLLVSRYRKERSGRRGFSVSSPQLWNSLPTVIRLLHNEIQLFRKRLKTHYMQQPMLCHWGSMSTVWSLLLLLLLLLRRYSTIW